MSNKDLESFSRRVIRPEAGVLAQSEYRGLSTERHGNKSAEGRRESPTARTPAARAATVALIFALSAAGWPAFAQRQPVLQQIDVPHSYYFREMYLPRVTSGPGAVAWSPDGRELVFSMQGSLWKQAVDGTVAQQLTAGPGYDLQPDWSARNGRIVFVRYANDAMELIELDPVTGQQRALTASGAVNVEPRWSPDGARLAWVSTAGSGHFHVFTGEVTAAGLSGAPLWPERRSQVARYYYSAFDHEISPAWSPAGDELIYVGNPEIAYGTGSLWRRGLGPEAPPVLVRAEETTWKARPKWSPDGRRVIWSSYAGRQWHQLWITPAAGGDPFALSYGEFDITHARWSPDGQRIAFIANRSGGTEIGVQDVVGGRRHWLRTGERKFLKPMGTLRLSIMDGTNRPVAARVAIVGADGRSVAPDAAWLHADDGFDRRLAAFETHYFHAAGEVTVALPPGPARITAWRGPERQVTRRTLTIMPGQKQSLTLASSSLDLPAGWRDHWVSGDVHVHMNYGGTYRNTPERLVAQAAAEDLDVVHNLIVNKEQRIPDIDYFSAAPDAASTPAVLLLHAQEFHTSYWGHLGLLGLNEHLLLPDYSAYAGTAAASLYPTNAAVADLARRQGALVGYVHPFDAEPAPATDAQLTNALPVDAALGKIDYYEVVGFSDHLATAAVWHRLLNCGLRLPAAAGTDAMANFASLRGPVGVNRVYVEMPDVPASPTARRDAWLAGLKAGRTLATNAPLLGFAVEGAGPGGELTLPGGRHRLRYRGWLRSAVPVDHLELMRNGAVVKRIALRGDRRSADFDGTLTVAGTGYLLLRAYSATASPDVFDLYPYGTTGPVYVTVGGAPARSPDDAAYFLGWLDRLDAAASAHPGYNTPAERTAVLTEIRAARGIFERCAQAPASP